MGDGGAVGKGWGVWQRWMCRDGQWGRKGSQAISAWAGACHAEGVGGVVGSYGQGWGGERVHKVGQRCQPMLKAKGQ